MKNARYQFTFALLLCILPSIFVGCSTTAGNSDRIIVTFWHGMESGTNNKVLQAKIDEFNAKHPKIFIDAQVYGAADQLGPKLDAAVAGKTPPDLLWWAPAFFPKYADAGALRNVEDFIQEDMALSQPPPLFKPDLTRNGHLGALLAEDLNFNPEIGCRYRFTVRALIAEDRDFNKSDVYDFLWDVGSYKGKIYATPFSANALAIYYNKQKFAEAGITELPRTWEDFKTAAQKLTHGDTKGMLIPIGSSEWTVWTWQTFLWQAGGEFLTEDQRAAAFNSPAGVAALDFWRTLLKDGSGVFSETDAGYITESFLNGRVAMMINGPWNYASLKDQNAVDIGVLPLPGKERSATNIGGESLFLFKSNRQKERAAWEFMKFIMSPDFQVDWAINTGYLPVSKSAANSAEYQAFLQANPFMKTYNEQMAIGKTRPSISQYPAISATLGKYLEAALYDKYSSQEALDKAAEETNKLLAKGK